MVTVIEEECCSGCGSTFYEGEPFFWPESKPTFRVCDGCLPDLERDAKRIKDEIFSGVVDAREEDEDGEEEEDSY